MTESAGLLVQEEIAKKETFGYKDDEQYKLFCYYKTRLEKARDVRALPREEWDGLDFESYIASCRQTKNSYLRPKINDNEVRVGMADVEKKVESVCNEIVTLNLQPEVQVFDVNDKMLVELGEDLGDIVKKSNIIERDDDVWQEAIMSVLTYPITIVEECYVSRKIGYGKDAEKKICVKNLLHPSQLFFEDIFIPYYRLNDQPGLIKYEKKTYMEANAVYGDLPGWEFVQPGQPNQNNYNLYNYNYRFSQLGEDEVEILHFYDYHNDEYMLMIQGLMMFDRPKSYKKEFGDFNGYHFSISGIKTFSTDFIYFKSLVSSARVLAGLKQGLLRDFIRKFRLAMEPVLGVSSGKGKIFNRNIWEPGNTVQGVKADDFSVLNQWNRGIEQGDVELLNIIDKATNDMMGVDPIMQGSSGKKLTAAQTQESMKQALKMLGLSVAAVIRLKRDMTYLRIYNILNHQMISTGQKKINGILQNIYQNYTIDDTYISSGKKGQKRIIVHDDDKRPLPFELSQAYQQEASARSTGQEVKYRFLNAKMLRTIPLMIFVTVDAAERDGSNLQKIMFNDMLNDAVEVTKASNGTKQINANKFADELERVWKKKDLFMDAPQQQPGQQPQDGGEEGGGAGGDTGMSSQLGKGIRKPQKPSVKQLGTMLTAGK